MFNSSWNAQLRTNLSSNVESLYKMAYYCEWRYCIKTETSVIMNCFIFGGGVYLFNQNRNQLLFSFITQRQMHRLTDRQLLKHMTMFCDFIQEFTSLQPVQDFRIYTVQKKKILSIFYFKKEIADFLTLSTKYIVCGYPGISWGLST